MGAVMSRSLVDVFEQEMRGVFHRETLPTAVAVAVSGGSDSMALTLLLKDWCQINGVALVAFTVDHALRDEAAEEAKLVGRWLLDQGVEHHILTREGDKPSSGMQSFARSARYDLMRAACNERTIKFLFIGHQAEDQLETFVLRLSKGSSLAGLVSMSNISDRDSLNIVRPLLSVRRKELRDFLVTENQDWVEDPSNEDPRYTRTELGRVVSAISTLPGSNFDAFSLSLNRLKKADEALEFYVEKAWAENVVISPYGYLTLRRELFIQFPSEISLRILGRAVAMVSGSKRYNRLSELERLNEDLKQNTGEKYYTLSGCQFRMQNIDIQICREPGRNGLSTVPFSGGDLIWDNRFLVRELDTVFSDENLKIGPLGDEGWRVLKESVPRLDAEKLPAIVRKNIPAVWKEDKLLAAPLVLAENIGLGIAKRRFEMVFMPLAGSEK